MEEMLSEKARTLDPLTMRNIHDERNIAYDATKGRKFSDA